MIITNTNGDTYCRDVDTNEDVLGENSRKMGGRVCAACVRYGGVKLPCSRALAQIGSSGSRHGQRGDGLSNEP